MRAFVAILVVVALAGCSSAPVSRITEADLAGKWIKVDCKAKLDKPEKGAYLDFDGCAHTFVTSDPTPRHPDGVCKPNYDPSRDDIYVRVWMTAYVANADMEPIPQTGIVLWNGFTPGYTAPIGDDAGKAFTCTIGLPLSKGFGTYAADFKWTEYRWVDNYYANYYSWTPDGNENHVHRVKIHSGTRL